VYIYIYIYIYIKVMKGAEYFVSLLPRWYNVMVNTDELRVIATAGYLTLQARCRIKRYRYNRVRLCVWVCLFIYIIYINISTQFKFLESAEGRFGRSFRNACRYSYLSISKTSYTVRRKYLLAVL
jgi:hypothetical protein